MVCGSIEQYSPRITTGSVMSQAKLLHECYMERLRVQAGKGGVDPSIVAKVAHYKFAEEFVRYQLTRKTRNKRATNVNLNHNLRSSRKSKVTESCKLRAKDSNSCSKRPKSADEAKALKILPHLLNDDESCVSKMLP